MVIKLSSDLKRIYLGYEPKGKSFFIFTIYMSYKICIELMYKLERLIERGIK